MKAIIPIILFTLLSISALGQLTEQELDHNNAATTISNSGSFFTIPSNGSAGYEIPKGGGVDAIYASQFWFGAQEINGMLHTSIGGNNQGTDVDQGPFSSTNSYTNPDYDRTYMITLCQEEIDNFVLWWECSNGPGDPGCSTVMQPSSDVLNSIYDWPGNGNPAIGQAAQLAPFFDRNGDGV